MNYFQFLLKAKGRHGIHSPFVYAFVEEVLRKKNNINHEWAEQGYSEKELKILRKIINYIQTELIFIPQKELLFLKELIPKSFKDIKLVLEAGCLDQEKCTNSLIIIDFKFFNQDLNHLLQKTKSSDNVFIFIFNIHKNKYLHDKWIKIVKSSMFNMTIDIWHAGLAIRHRDFKRKQHFFMK